MNGLDSTLNYIGKMVNDTTRAIMGAMPNSTSIAPKVVGCPSCAQAAQARATQASIQTAPSPVMRQMAPPQHNIVFNAEAQTSTPVAKRNPSVYNAPPPDNSSGVRFN